MGIQRLLWLAKKCPYLFITTHKRLKNAEKECLNAIIRINKFLYA